MSAPERGPAEFEAAPFDAVCDLWGDPIDAGLRVLLAGNQYMVVPDLVAGFVEEHAPVGSVFCETLPPGVLVAQLRAGGLRMGTLELRFVPDVVALGPAALAELHEEGWVGPARPYASNTLSLLVAAGNPAGVEGLADLARPGLRVALPDPATEGIGRLALAALDAAGGSTLVERVNGEKRRSGETVLTTIHHRQSPGWLAAGFVDAAVVWVTEAGYHRRVGTPVEAVPIAASVNQRGAYAVAPVAAGPNPEAAALFVDHLAGPAGSAVYGRHGFDRPGD